MGVRKVKKKVDITKLKTKKETVSIRKENNPAIFYDITTTTGNYIANNFIVHNCTPRGWEYLSRQLRFVDSNDFELLENLISANVGEATAIEMIAFLKLSQKIKIEEILENPKKINEFKDRPDLKYSLISELANLYKKNTKVFDKIMKVVELLEPEFAILCLRLLRMSNEKHFVKNAIKYDWIKDYAKYLL